MNKGLIIGLVLLLLGFVLQAQGGEIRQPLPLTEVTVVTDLEGFAQFTGEDLQFTTLSGEPELPFHVIRLLLPPDTDLASVTAELEQVTTEPLPGQFDVRPVPPMACRDGDNFISVFPEGKTIVDGKDVAIYETDAFFPTNFITSVTVGQIREAMTVEVVVATHQWNPIAQ